MKSLKNILLSSSLILLALLLASCVATGNKTASQQDAGLTQQNPQRAVEATSPLAPLQPATLPVRYQRATYFVDQEAQQDHEEEILAEQSALKVGARITSTRGAQPVHDILKRLATLKNMSISWARDVDQTATVDVNINSTDLFSSAINNLLSQIGYFAEINDNTIFVKHKVTKQYQIAMPFISQEFTTSTGGDIIGGGSGESGLTAEIKLNSKGSPVGTPYTGRSQEGKIEFDTWANIETNLKVILDISESGEREVRSSAGEFGYSDTGRRVELERDNLSSSSETTTGSARGTRESAGTADLVTIKTARQVAKDGSYFLIDKPVGIITITTTQDMHKVVENYIQSLKKALFLQVSIEAKIIEVQMRDASSIGINWSEVLNNFNINGVVQFGAQGLGVGGQVYPFIFSNDEVVGRNTYFGDDRSSYSRTINPGQFVSRIGINSANFDVFLNALNEQGDTKILSNPKISVLNGQPAFITVGRNVTYVDSIESDKDENGVVTFTVNTDRILSGVGMALTATVHDGDEVVLNLVPITSELQEPIEYLTVGSDGATVGLPIVNVREMATTVRVKDNEMLVIGGLISESEQNEGSFAPLLGDIPLVRYLFGYEKKEKLKRELIILLRPTII